MFLFLMITITLGIAGCAAYFSVYGLAHIFTSVFWSTVIMGASLEAGKLMTASYLYRYWTHTGFLLKSYLIVAMAGLMLLTSVGIYGYLSAGYQTDSLPLKQMESRLLLLNSEQDQINERLLEINGDINRIGADYISKRMELIDKYQGEKTQKTERLAAVRQEIYDLSNAKIQQQAHTGPIIYIAKQLGKEVDDAISYMVLLIIFIFDPLAIALTICCNIVIANNKQQKNTTTIAPIESVPEPETQAVEPEVTLVEPAPKPDPIEPVPDPEPEIIPEPEVTPIEPEPELSSEPDLITEPVPDPEPTPKPEPTPTIRESVDVNTQVNNKKTGSRRVYDSIPKEAFYVPSPYE